MSIEQLEVTILAYLRKAKEAGMGDIIANALKGTEYTFPQMKEALGNLRENGKLNWSIKENKYLFVEKKNAASDKRKTSVKKPSE